ncbi:MAG: EcsC family protein [Oscillospiraceae bacterium]|nr:EcsC family protein [Oscillospiraceae bacterium]
MGKKISQEEIMQLLDKLYSQSVEGIAQVSPPVDKLANDYLQKAENVDAAAKKLIAYQVAKCTTSGFLTGLGGLITLPVAIPANVGSVMYVQMRMIACLAYMGGYDTSSDQVQTLVYACLAGISIDQILKNVGIQFGTKFTMAMVKKIPGTVLTKINQKVGFRFLTKFGSKGLINLGKAVPIVGGVIGGGFDFTETKIIATRAYKMFIQGDLGVLSSNDDESVEIVEDIEVAGNS